MHIKKFIFVFFFILAAGLLALSAKDLIFIYSAESQLARVDHHEPAKSETYHKLSGSYEEKMLSPAIAYAVNEKEYMFIPEYSCKDGCESVGSEIVIFYQKDDPTKVLVSSFAGLWKAKIYFLIIMAALLLFSVPYLYYNVSKQRES